jgi:phage tail sheath gpL-like
MPISFEQIPDGILTPLYILEVSNRAAEGGPAEIAYRGLMVGQMTAAGTATANVRRLVTSADQVATLTGRGSILHRMAIAWFRLNKFTEVWILPVEDDGAGVAASGSIEITGPAAASGALNYRISGDAVRVAVANEDTAAEMAEALRDAIAALPDLPIDVDGAKYTATAGGTATDGDYELEFDGFGLGAPVTVTVTRATTPATNSDLGAALRTALATALAGSLADVLKSTGGAGAAATYTFLAGLPTGTVTPAAPAPGTLTVAATDAGKVSYQAKNKGLVGNDIDVRANWREGDEYPDGVDATITPMASGATNPDCTDALAAIGDEWHQVWAHPWRDADNLDALEAEALRRWEAGVEKHCVIIGGARGSLETMVTLGDTRNSPHSSLVAPEGTDPLAAPWDYAAANAARAALSGARQPNQPLQTLTLGLPVGRLPFTREERQVLLQHGIATTKPGPGGTLQIDRTVTTYKLNAAGAPDSSYRDITTMLTLLYLAYSWNVRWATKYPNALLATDAITAPPGKQVVTPKVGKAEAIGWFLQMQTKLLVQDVDQFQRDLVVQLNGPNRIEFLLPPKLIEGLIVGATQLQFRRAS